MTDVTMEEAKAVLRGVARQQRAALRQDQRLEAAAAAAQHFFDGIVVPAEAVVAGYWPIRDEIDVRPVLVRLVDGGQTLVLPVTEDDKPLTMRVWEPGTALYPSGFGTLAPIEGAPVLEPDLVITPLLGFDAQGTRLGYGMGHYDRTLAQMHKRPRLVGYAFAAQEIDHIPRDSHDIPLDAVVTEAGVRHFGARGDVQ